MLTKRTPAVWIARWDDGKESPVCGPHGRHITKRRETDARIYLPRIVRPADPHSDRCAYCP